MSGKPCQVLLLQEYLPNLLTLPLTLQKIASHSHYSLVPGKDPSALCHSEFAYPG